MLLSLQNFRIRDALAFSILALVVVCAYANALSNGFVFDDDVLIVNNSYLHQWSNWGLFFVSSHSVGGGVASPFYRPLQSLLYLLIYQTNGLSPVPYHALNIALHAANSCLVYVLGKKLGFNPVSVFLAALLWGVLPLHVEAVAYASATADVLYVFFCLLGLIVMVPDFTPRQILLSLPLFILGLLSKEAAVIFPALVVATQYFLTRHKSDVKIFIRLWPLWLTVGFYVFLHIILPIFVGLGLNNPYNMCNDALSCRLFTFFATLPAYLGLLILPLYLHPERSFPLFENPWHFAVIIGMAIFAMTAWLIKGIAASPRKKILAWGLSWFFIAYLPSSGILVPTNGVLMEHWLYLPTVGLFISLAETLRSSMPHNMRLPTIAMIMVVALCWGIRTQEQNKTWHDPQIFYANILAGEDHLPRAHIDFGSFYMRHGDNIHALEQFNQAIVRSGDSLAEAQYGYGAVLYKTAMSTKDIYSSITHFKRALELNLDLFEADRALAAAYAELGEPDGALFYQEQANITSQKMRSTFLPSPLEAPSR